MFLPNRSPKSCKNDDFTIRIDIAVNKIWDKNDGNITIKLTRMVRFKYFLAKNEEK
jgi:hypothetical protein